MIRFLCACLVAAVAWGSSDCTAIAELQRLQESRAVQEEREATHAVTVGGKKKERPKDWYRSERYPQLANRVGGTSRRLMRGLINLTTSPFEFPITFKRVGREEGWGKGVGKGMTRTLARVGTSLYEIATFCFLYNEEPRMQPEFVLDVGGTGREPMEPSRLEAGT
ncbi:MAG: hypothetical protein HYY14_04655 [Candidatus Omnitrophica bacterium]|nr:hypothetical protein [Candidatus Omnitrophota bacterium]